MYTHTKILRTIAALMLAIAGLSSASRADQYDAPASYYNNATGTGATLKNQLRIIIGNNVVRSYDSARQALAITDRDPNNPSNVLRIYDRQSVSGAWDGSTSSAWHREHIWPQSRLNGASISDYFNLRPILPSINSSRGNKPFGTTSTPQGASFGHQGDYYYPGADRGDVARSLFYMATRYSSQLTLVNGMPNNTQMGDLASLLKWHYEDTPDTFERRRNQEIYSNSTSSSYSQGNRNPYVDRPEYVWSVFGDGANDSKLYVSDSAPGNGTSAASVDLGRVMRNGAVPASKPVTLRKAGADPTYFEVTTTGNATSSVTGRFNAFGYGAQTRPLQVGLNAGTSSAGLKTGAVSINNLDITTQGAGTGVADGDDTITAQYAVLEKRQVQANAVTLGRVLVDGDVSHTAFLSTSGDDTAATRVDVALTSTTDANGLRIAGGTGMRFDSATAAGARSVAGHFTTPGAKAGSLQLPVATAEQGGAGLAGEGSYAPVSVAYSATALVHATPSFSEDGVQQILDLDFGQVVRDEQGVARTFSISNLETFAGFTASLDLDSITPVGDDSLFTTSISTFSGTNGLTAGESRLFEAFLDTSAEGLFAATYQLRFSDEDLPGASTDLLLTLVLHGEVTVPEPQVLGFLGLVVLLTRRVRKHESHQSH